MAQQAFNRMQSGMGGKGVGTRQLNPLMQPYVNAAIGQSAPVEPPPIMGIRPVYNAATGQNLQSGMGGKGVGQQPMQQPMQQPAPAPAPVGTAPMYSPHEGMLFGDDFYEKYAQNVGGQFKDPYHNFLMSGARKIGPDADIDRLYQQYKASGRTDTPDWATLDTTGPITTLPILAHKWDASGATPVERLSSAWNPTTPLVEGITVPEGYWDNYLAYNMNMSKINPSLVAEGGASNVQQLLDSNAQARYAMSQGEYGNQGPIYNSYMSPKQLAQKMQSDQQNHQRTIAEYNRQREANNEWARINKVDASEANSNLDALMAEAEARFAEIRAQDEARSQAQIQQQINSAMFAKGGLANLRRKY